MLVFKYEYILKEKLSEKANENANMSACSGEDQQNWDWTLITNTDFLWDKSAKWDIFIFLKALILCSTWADGVVTA